MIQLSQIPTSQPYINELKKILQFTKKKYGRYEYNVLKNLIVAAAFSSMLIRFISFSLFVRYITVELKDKGNPPSNLYYIKSIRLKERGTNATCFGIKVDTLLYKTTQETYLETIEYFRKNIYNIEKSSYAAFITQYFIK